MDAVAQFDRGTVAHPTSARGTYRAAVGAEWTKLRSLKSTVWSLVVTVAIAVGLGTLLCAATIARWDRLDPIDRLTFDPTGHGISGIFLAQLAIGVLGVLVIDSEYHPLDSHHVLGQAASAHRCHGQSNGARSGGVRPQPGRLLHCFRLGPGHPARQTCRRLTRRSASAACCRRRCVVPHIRRHHRLLDRDCPAAPPEPSQRCSPLCSSFPSGRMRCPAGGTTTSQNYFRRLPASLCSTLDRRGELLTPAHAILVLALWLTITFAAAIVAVSRRDV